MRPFGGAAIARLVSPASVTSATVKVPAVLCRLVVLRQEIDAFGAAAAEHPPAGGGDHDNDDGGEDRPAALHKAA